MSTAPLLEITGLRGIFTVRSTVDDAIAELSGR